jgi:hypothetical protein
MESSSSSSSSSSSAGSESFTKTRRFDLIIDLMERMDRLRL